MTTRPASRPPVRPPSRGVALLVALASALAVAGCSTLPTSGDVHTRPDRGAADYAEAPYFAPPGPTRGASPEGIVRGFLLAMQANPPSTAIARSFLSARARTTWKPVGTVVYDSSAVTGAGGTVQARLSDAHRLDPRGGWDTGATGATERITYSLVQEGGQWRIANPPNALAVPASYFPSLFVPFSLYFFDRSGSVLVPTRVYLPRGEQTASNLVRGLLRGPPPVEESVVASAFPARSELDLGVVVSDAGIADVPLSPQVLRLSPAELSRAVAQLAWTLRQVPGIVRLRVTVDGAAVPLADGQTEVSVREGADLDPVSAPDGTLVAIVDGRVVRLDAGGVTEVGGPLGRTGFALRSVGLDASARRVAAVSGNGRRLYLAADRGSRAASAVDVAVDGATDLLRPVFDRFGQLWTIDRTATGAVVHVVTGRTDRVVRVPLVSGRRVVAFTVTRDGTRVAVALAGGDGPRLVVAELERSAEGRLVRALPGYLVEVGDDDLGVVRDLGQDGGSTVGVLTQPSSGAPRVTSVELDGSPGVTTAGTPDVDATDVLALAISPDPALPPVVLAGDRRLLELSGSGEWVRTSVPGVRAVAYPQ